jgi:hypothetical protein
MITIQRKQLEQTAKVLVFWSDNDRNVQLKLGEAVPILYKIF